MQKLMALAKETWSTCPVSWLWPDILKARKMGISYMDIENSIRFTTGITGFRECMTILTGQPFDGL